MIKKVTMKQKSTNSQKDIDNFVTNNDISIKRITVEVSEVMHRHIKSQCAIKGVKMGAKIKDLLVKEFGNATK